MRALWQLKTTDPFSGWPLNFLKGAPAARSFAPHPGGRTKADAHWWGHRAAPPLAPVCMLLLLSTISALALPAEVQRVLTASDAYDVLQLVPGDWPSVRDLDMARRKLAVKLHPDKHGCPHGAVCDAAGRAMIRVNAAHDELKGATAQSTHRSSGGHTARPSAFWDRAQRCEVRN